MLIKQSLNQNAVLVLDEKNNEFVALGKGIGFGKKKGDIISVESINKLYSIKSTPQEQKIINSLKNIDENILLIAEDIRRRAQALLKEDLANTFTFSLANHLQYAIERKENNIEIGQPFQYEMKYLYPKEYEVAKWAVTYINETYQYQLDESEISFFTLHFVNGLIDNEEFKEVVKLSNILNEIVELIEENNIVIDKNSIDFARFITHLRYFAIRNLSYSNKKKAKYDSKLKELYLLTVQMYPTQNWIVNKIKEYLSESYDIHYGIEEDFYLLLHIMRLTNRTKGD